AAISAPRPSPRTTGLALGLNLRIPSVQLMTSSRPPVDDVADEIDRIGIVVAQEVEQPIGLAAFGSEMHVGDEQRAKRRCASRGHDIAILLRITKRERLTALCCATMTPATLRVT